MDIHNYRVYAVWAFHKDILHNDHIAPQLFQDSRRSATCYFLCYWQVRHPTTITLYADGDIYPCCTSTGTHTVSRSGWMASGVQRWCDPWFWWQAVWFRSRPLEEEGSGPGIREWHLSWCRCSGKCGTRTNPGDWLKYTQRYFIISWWRHQMETFSA